MDANDCFLMKEPTVYHVQKGRLVRMPDPGAFGRGDCYLVDAGQKIYLWIGPKSTADEKFLTAASAVMSDTDREGKADIDRIEGGNEPEGFKALFDDFRLTDEDTEGLLKKVHLETHEYKLWRVHREGDETYFAEVPVNKDSLKTDDVFLLDTWDDIFVWRGKGASSREKFDGTILARRYDAERAGVQEIELIEEGDEPEEFLKAFP
ncbi:MAG: hypothetical protein KAR03_09750 [Candidatus Thorarchaeota archaeon]|nr:hypothetical protein [Candidatus Thorarchaeota archaeon]